MVRHDENGALGLVVNKTAHSAKFSVLLEAIGADPEDIEGEIQIHYGGPVEPNKGFVLHTTDYEPAMIRVNDEYGVSMSAEILKAMARGKGPARALLALGYAGWAGGQLEGELKRGSWAVAPADPEILFDGNYETKWDRARKRRYMST
jgi:putative transcriptional regulator